MVIRFERLMKDWMGVGQNGEYEEGGAASGRVS
jgi:hypothetical protein